MKIDPLFVVPALVAVLVLSWLFYDSARTQRREQQLREAGTRARVRVVSASQTGHWVANNPELALQLVLSEPGRPERELSVRHVIPVQAAGLLVPGAVLQVRLDPHQPDVFVFDEPWAVAASGLR
ncbi:hypothetical protein OOT46_26370 [Aquabacterium sp. A7-Y]|uniref:hypothetical protein n=1 Tax=Aquabacterium sp. A7-Y TaxID=1349605 RepID=UPI00223D36DF|nr:hypothetical protein [Aquabacterium sp. A7-Y]MCW7541341.1 hypothetical protein [Aquabacterium sp. A7-Y]